MRDPEEVLAAVVEALDAERIEYAVTGALASAYHGYPRATDDLDIKVRIDDADALDRAHARMPAGTRRIDGLTWSVDDRWLVELYPLRDALDREAFRERVRARLFETNDHEYWVVPLEALLVLKVREHVRHGHGLKHIADVQALLARNADVLDVKQLERLLALDPALGKTWDRLVEPG